MIDYDKLREAIELAKKLPEIYCVAIEVGANGVMFSIDILDGDPDSCLIYDVSLDELIIKIRERTKPEPKPLYAVFDVVYHLNDEYQIACMRISEIDLKSDEMYYGVDELNDDGGNWWMEEQLYPTREALIKAQIEYWHGLLFPEDAKSSCCSVHAGSSEECGEFCQ